MGIQLTWVLLASGHGIGTSATLGFILLGLDKQTSAKSKSRHLFQLDQHL